VVSLIQVQPLPERRRVPQADLTVPAAGGQRPASGSAGHARGPDAVGVPRDQQPAAVQVPAPQPADGVSTDEAPSIG
jgi:hypothetical protein